MTHFQQAAPVSKKSDGDDESALFAQAMAGTRRLQHNKVKPHRSRIRPVPQQRLLDEQASLRESLTQPLLSEEIETGDELLYRRGGVQNTVIRKLKRGHYPIEAELDLHRLTSAQAFEALVLFLKKCQLRGLRCVRIIHGKGLGSKEKKPVLKGKVNQWLQRRDEILAFCSATPTDGGSGAVYVLLRRKM